MHTLIVCLFIACLLPYLSKVPMAIAMNRQPGGYDNNHPRTQQALLIGFGARALAAHQNSFESLIVFSSAVLTALATQTINANTQGLAIGYLIARGIYHLLYLMNHSTLRSIVWGVSLFCSLGIILLCLM